MAETIVIATPAPARYASHCRGWLPGAGSEVGSDFGVAVAMTGDDWSAMTFLFDGAMGVASPAQEEPREPIRGANGARSGSTGCDCLRACCLVRGFLGYSVRRDPTVGDRAGLMRV